jgi:RNA polymerase sigma factor (sigma-70 family)
LQPNWLDTQIIDGCLRNNRKSQELLYKHFYTSMMALCMRYTRHEADALEVLHNGFLKVFKHLHTYDTQKASLYTWIKTIVVNTAIDFIRSKQKFGTTIELTEAVTVKIENDAIQRMSATELLHLVRKLPKATQTVFNLYVIEGYNHREVGQLLSISEGTSKWHLSEARRQLQQLLCKTNLQPAE